MPEPKDIDVLEDKITDPLAILQEYNREHKKSVPKETKEQILDIFRNINPVFECEPGGSKYRKVVEDTLAEIDFPTGEEIKFGNDVNYEEIISEVMKGTKNKNIKLRGEK